MYLISALCFCFGGLGAAVDDASQWGETGKKLHFSGDAEGAMDAYKRARQASNQHSRTYSDATIGIAGLHQEAGDLEKAIPFFEEIASWDHESMAGQNLKEAQKMMNLRHKVLPASQRTEVAAALRTIPQQDTTVCKPTFVHAWRNILPNRTLDGIENSMFKLNAWVTERADHQITYWKPKDRISKPRNAMELAIYQLRKLVPLPDAELGGAEWWLRNHSVKIGMNLHVDQDLLTKDRTNSVPAFSTVLYLSDVGGATYVMNQAVVDGGLTPPIPLSAAFSTPQRGLFMLFKGNLVHGVLNPTVEHSGHRLSMVINWWRKKPSPPACGSVPKELQKIVEFKLDKVLDKVKILPAEHEDNQLNLTCAEPSEVIKGRRYSTFGIYQVPLPVPSYHEPGEVSILDFKRCAELSASERTDL